MPTLPPPEPCHDCPPDAQLGGLIRGDLADPASAAVTDHVGACIGCQDRLDRLAAPGGPPLSDILHHIDRSGPASDSAYWPAVDRVAASLTGDFPLDGSPDGPVAPRDDLKLDFLRPSDEPGRLGLLSTFEVVRVVGRGGMGVVLHGWDPCLRRDVALKVLDPQLANNSTARQRFCREARAAAAVIHDNVVAVHQVDEDAGSGLPFLVMQLVAGESLDQRLRRVGRLGVAETVRVGAQAAAGLARAHAGGLIHRDIKPGNILIEKDTDKVKLTDFGLARAAEDLKLTTTGFVAGTPLYMAPEQARGDEIDARADLFSLGSVLYEALAGEPPFSGKTPLAVLRRVADDAHISLRKLNPEVPAWLEEVIDRLLEKDPADRYDTAAEVSELLSAHLALPTSVLTEQGCGSAVLLGTRLSRRRRWHLCRKQVALAGGAYLFGAASVGVGGWALWPPAFTPANPAAVAPALDPGPKPTLTLPAGAGGVWSVAVSPDGTVLATGLESGRVNLWAVSGPTPRLLGSLTDHKGPVWSVNFLPMSNRLVSASDDATVKIWDVPKQQLVYSIPVQTPVRAAAVSPDGTYLAVGNRLGDVQVWDLKSQKPITQYRHDGAVNGVAFSPDNLSVASVGSDMTVVLWDVARDRKRFTLSGHAGPVYGVGFSPDGDRLATSGWDQTIVVWDLTTGTAVRKIAAGDEVWAVQFSPGGGRLATAEQDGTARLWDADTGAALVTFAAHRGAAHTLRFGPHGKTLATGGRDGTVRVWDTTPY